MPARAPIHPVLLSAILPGLGQFAQRRWVAGIVYLVANLTPAGALVWLVVRGLMLNLQAALAFAAGEPNRPFATPHIPLILGLAAISIVAYVACLLDAHWAHRRALRRRYGDSGTMACTR
jgi:hypothetical protein